MTVTGLQGVLDSAKPIGDAVWYFFQDFKIYKDKFTDKKGKLLERKEILEKYPKLIEKYDEIKEAMSWKDISDMTWDSIRKVDKKEDNLISIPSDNTIPSEIYPGQGL